MCLHYATRLSLSVCFLPWTMFRTLVARATRRVALSVVHISTVGGASGAGAAAAAGGVPSFRRGVLNVVGDPSTGRHMGTSKKLGRGYATTNANAAATEEGGSRISVQNAGIAVLGALCAYEAARSFQEKTKDAAAAHKKLGATHAEKGQQQVVVAEVAATKKKSSKEKSSSSSSSSSPSKDNNNKSSSSSSSSSSTSSTTPPAPPVAKSEGDLFYAQLLTQRRIFLNGRVDDKSAHNLVGKMLFLDAVDPETPIVMYINSGGGVVTSGLAIYDVMMHIRPPVYTVCLGHAESMAAVLLCAGEKGHRYALPNARIMIHQPHHVISGQTSDIIIKVRTTTTTTTTTIPCVSVCAVYFIFFVCFIFLSRGC